MLDQTHRPDHGAARRRAVSERSPVTSPEPDQPGVGTLRLDPQLLVTVDQSCPIAPVHRLQCDGPTVHPETVDFDALPG